MDKKNYKYIYGPVPSWRLGSSLGIDPLSVKDKVCPFDCVYCQIGKTKCLTDKRKIFVKTEDIITEFKSLPPLEIDYITFSGTGEPTLAKNLGEMIKEIKKIKKQDTKIAVLTNSALLNDKTVREDLFSADFVAAKLDAVQDDIFQAVNKPMKNLKLETIIKTIKKFKNDYNGNSLCKLCLCRTIKNTRKNSDARRAKLFRMKFSLTLRFARKELNR